MLRFGSWFSGGGVLEAALPAGLVEHAHAVEFDHDIAMHYLKAHGHRPLVKSVLDVSPQELHDAKLDHFHVSPVCKSFSGARRQAPTPEALEFDRKTARHVAAGIEAARPNTITLENVPKYFNTADFGGHILNAMRDMGYHVDVQNVDAKRHGGAMSRQRTIVRAARKRSDIPAMPAETPHVPWNVAIAGHPSGPQMNTGNWVTKTSVAAGAPIGIRRVLHMGDNSWAEEGHPAPSMVSSEGTVPRIITPGQPTLRLSGGQMRALMGLPKTFLLPDTWRMAKKVLGNGIHGATTKAAITPFLMRAYSSRQRYTVT